METAVHLVSMPFCGTRTPSIQLGCLKAYLDSVFAGAVGVNTYSAYFGIMVLERESPETSDGGPGMFDRIDSLDVGTQFFTPATETQPKSPTYAERSWLAERP